MNVIEAIVFGLIQGLTEFLPVSSSGHLVLAKSLMGIEEPGMVFEIFVHFGTVLSILLVFRKDIIALVSGFFKLNFSGRKNISGEERENGMLSWYIILGSIPAGLIGFTLKDEIEALFAVGSEKGDASLVSWMLLLTGLILFLTRWAKDENKPVGFINSFIIGIGQAFAILPGVSRSGTTISMALFMGIERERAARFSFLLSLPVIIGATLKQSIDMFQLQFQFGNIILPLFVATFVAFVSGYFAILFLLDLVKKGKFSYFAYYCWAIGLLTLIFL